MFGDTEAVIDRSIATCGIKPRGCAKLFGVDQRYRLQIFGAIAGLRNELGPMAIFVPVATLPNECLIGQTFGDDDVRHRGQHGNVRSGTKRKMVLRLDMRRTDNVGTARVDDDQLSARAPILSAQTALHPAGKYRVSVGGVGPDDQDDVGIFDAIKILRSRAGAKGCFEAVSGRRMAHTRAGIDIVIAKACPDKFLHKEGFFIGATA